MRGSPALAQETLHPRVISRQEYLRTGYRTDPSLTLRFPAHWRAEPSRSPHSAQWELDTVRWLARHDIGRTSREAERLRKFDMAGYGGYALPRAATEPGLWITRYISLWLFWDDMQVEQRVDWDIDAVLGALTGEVPACARCRYERAWADLGIHLRRTQSAHWLRGLANSMRAWLDNAKRETQVAEAYRAGVLPEPEDLFECRTVSIGMFPMFYLDEFACGFELPEHVRRHDAMVQLERLSSRLVGLGNDLGGLAKDLRDGWINLAVVSSQRHRVPLSSAVRRLVELHNREVLEFDQVANALPVFGAEVDRRVRAWVQAVRHNVFGFTTWESLAERYQEVTVVEGDFALVAPVATLDAAPDADRLGSTP